MRATAADIAGMLQRGEAISLHIGRRNLGQTGEWERRIEQAHGPSMRPYIHFTQSASMRTATLLWKLGSSFSLAFVSRLFVRHYGTAQ